MWTPNKTFPTFRKIRGRGARGGRARVHDHDHVPRCRDYDGQLAEEALQL